jgi:hypothetical protein
MSTGLKDGCIKVVLTASHIQDMPWYKPHNPPQGRAALFRIEPGR